MEFEKSRTWANLMSAFAGESQARTKYENYAQKASEQGYEQIAAIFRATAANELAHASIWLEALHEGRKDCVDLPVLRAYPRGGSGSDALSALRQGPGLLRGAQPGSVIPLYTQKPSGAV